MGDSPLRLLHIEDNPGDAVLLRETLAMLDEAYELEHVQTAAAGVAALQARAFDAVLVDLSLPDDCCIQSIERLLSIAPTMPIIVLTDQQDGDLATSAMHAGAQDSLVKSAFDGPTLRRALLHSIERCRLAAELDRMRQRAMDVKDQLLSHVSHELRTPLAAMYQFTTILLDGLAGELAHEQREYLSIILRNAGQLRRMIEDLLEVSRLDSGQIVIQLRRFLLEPLVSSTLAQYEANAAARSVALSRGDCPCAEVLADPERVRQILSILLDNALKFTPAGGHIVVNAGLDPADRGCVRLSVHDSGCGIPEDDLNRVFERLYQTTCLPVDSSRRGLGLGLYICRDHVARQGGRIWVESRPGDGANFLFTLPVFSMARLLEPLVQPASPVMHLLRVALTRRGADCESPPTESMSNAALDVLRTAVRAGRNLLLPLPASDEPAGVFWVVTRAEPATARMLADQLAAEVRLKAQLDATTFDVEVSTLPLAFAGATPEARAASAALAIQRIHANPGKEISCPIRC